MIIPPGRLKVLAATQPVDFRKGMAGLASLVQQELRLDPFSGMLFVFRARRADRIKLLLWGLEHILKLINRSTFGKRSEKLPVDQLALTLEDQDVALGEADGLQDKASEEA